MKYALAFAALTFIGGAAVAEETTVIHRDSDRTTIVAPPSGEKTTTVTKHGDGCTDKTVRKENGMGDSKTVTRSDCD